jgi:large subunit ribosomal protein L28
VQYPNLQTVTIQTPNGKVRLTVSTKVMKSAAFVAVVAGAKPIPREWLIKPKYE